MTTMEVKIFSVVIFGLFSTSKPMRMPRNHLITTTIISVSFSAHATPFGRINKFFAGNSTISPTPTTLPCGCQSAVMTQVQSPNYPNEYPSGLDCLWYLSSPNRIRVELRFLSNIHLTKNIDFLTIFSGNGTEQRNQLIS